MSQDVSEDKLIRLLKKVRAEEAQRLSRCKSVETILANRVQELEDLRSKLESKNKELESLESRLSILVFAEGQATGFKVLNKRKLLILERISKFESAVSETCNSVEKAREHLALAQCELQATITSRKTIEQMHEKRKIAQHLLAEQEEESRLEDFHSRRVDLSINSKTIK